MGKFPYYTDSDETEDNFSSVENVKKKKKISIFSNNNSKKKLKSQSKSEPDDRSGTSHSSIRSRSRSRSNTMMKPKLRGILKHTEKESSDEEDVPSWAVSQDRRRDLSRCLVGQVPRPPGTKPGRGGGFAIIVRKNTSNLPAPITSSAKKRSSLKRLSRKRSY